AGEHTDGVVQVAVQPPVGRIVRLDPVGDHRQVQAHRRRCAGVPFGDGSKGRHQIPGVRPAGGGQGVELVPAREDGGEQRGLGAEVVQQPGLGDLCRVGDGAQRGARIPVLGEQVEGLGQDPLVLVFPTRRWASGTAGSSVPGRRDSRGVLALLRIAGLPCTVSLPRIVAPRTVKLPRIAAPCTVSLLRIVAPRCGGGVLCHGKHSTDYLLTGRLIMATVVGLQDTEVLFLGDEADVDTRALDVARRPSLTPNREGDPVPAPLTEANVPAVLAELTLEQKASLCSGQDFWHTQAIDGAGVPAVMVTDGPHGLRKQAGSADHLGLNSSVPATCLPSAAGLASTWNRELIRRAGEALGVEARGNGVAVLLGRGVNMKRTPLCGRNFEYFSEDPYLAGELATELVLDIQSQGVGTSLKHFAANNQETDRMRVDVEVDERTLREIYLPAFEKVVTRAQPWTVMCSYNKLGGTYASQHPWLLTDVLRTEWGFEGLVVSDWGATDDRVAGLKAGL